MTSVCDLVGLLRERAQTSGEERAYAFLPDGEHCGQELTFAEVATAAAEIAASLQQRGMSGTSLILAFPPGLDFVVAFWGCLFAGAIPIPAPWVEATGRRRAVNRLASIVADANPRHVLSTTAASEHLSEALVSEAGRAVPSVLCLEDLATGEPDLWIAPSVDPAAVAYLQYTSGSTHDPKGVRVTHGNVLANCDFLGRVCGFSKRSTLVNWVPTFHDQGLIYGVIEPVFAGFTAVHMPSGAFVEKPVRWLRAISRYRATHAGGPNFTYDLCVRRTTPTECEGLDLRGWTNAYNAAEPVRASTLDRFGQAFGPFGFSPDAFQACYGLAEATLRVAASPLGARPRAVAFDASALEAGRAVALTPGGDGQRQTVLVGHGPTAYPGRNILLVDPSTREVLGEGQVGEVWVWGPDVAHGYLNRPEETRDVFASQAQGDDRTYLATGDLGFSYRGELFLVGRLKDVIIIRGTNHAASDIERSIEENSPGVRPGAVAALGLPGEEGEQLVVVAEVARGSVGSDFGGTLRAIQQAVVSHHDIKAEAIVLTIPGALPKTSSGKLQRSLAKMMFSRGQFETIASAMFREEASPPSMVPVSDLQEWLVKRLAAQTGLPPSQIDVHRSFSEVGLDSLGAVELMSALAGHLGRSLSATLIWDFPTPRALVDHLSVPHRTGPRHVATQIRSPAESSASVAIVGMSCRFPGAESLEAYWRLLEGGVDAITEVPPERWNADAYFSAQPAPGKTNSRWGGFLHGVDLFDRELFGMSPDAAAYTDPQHRLLLEVACEALEDANLAFHGLKGSRTGVFVGITQFDYGRLVLAPNAGSSPFAAPGTSHALAANRLSYFFDLHGPSLAIDTACSSSLVALKSACAAIQSGASEFALVGGVNLILTPEKTVALSQGTFLSPDGRCKSFDASANGYVRGEGVGVVVLKSLERAQNDGDRIYAVILGVAVNQDGRTNGLTAPNGLAQQRVIREALEAAGVAPSALGYVEAHGTGTSLGDPIEAQALGTVLGEGRSSEQPCAVGSVKSNIGHLEAAAGVAGLIKVALCVHRRTKVPSLHFQTPNPHIPFERLKLRVQQRAEPWEEPCIAGVSSFGFGGTNAHAILQGVPSLVEAPEEATPDQQPHLLLLSGANTQATKELAQRYLTHPALEMPLSDVCYVAAARRSHRSYRMAVSGRTSAEIRASLQRWVDSEPTPGVVTGDAQTGFSPRFGFLYSGQASQYVGMGRELYTTQPVFRSALDRCAELLEGVLERPLLDVMFGVESKGPSLDDTAYTQPALFAMGYALSEMWGAFGIRPHAVMGHSVGELVAACVAGLFDLEGGLRLIAARGRLMQSLEQGGRMLAVRASAERLAAWPKRFPSELSVAAFNGPRSVVLSGVGARLEEARIALEAEGLECKYLSVPLGAHSPLMDPILDAFEADAAKVTYGTPHAMIVSNLTGRVATTEELSSARYWRRHLREPVRFSEGLRALLGTGCNVLIEMGPHPTLLGIAQAEGPIPEVSCLASLRRGRPDWEQLLESVGTLFVRGGSLDWEKFYPSHRRKRVDLPLTPFRRSRCWIPEVVPDQSVPAEVGTWASWLWQMKWSERLALPAGTRPSKGRWLIVSSAERSRVIGDELRRMGGTCVYARLGSIARKVDGEHYELDFRDREAFFALLGGALSKEKFEGVIHFSEEAEPPSAGNARSTSLELEPLRYATDSALYLAQALLASPWIPRPRLWVMTCGAQAVAGSTVRLSQAPTWGLARVIAREHPELRCVAIDLDPRDFARGVAAAIAELTADGSTAVEDQRAFRQGRWYVPRILPLALSRHAEASVPVVHPDATYLVTGGTGALGRVVVQSFIELGARSLALMARKDWGPEGAQWQRDLEAAGVTLELLQGDVSIEEDVARALAQVRCWERPLKGVVHCAGVLADRELQAQAAETWDPVWAPKVLGAGHLHTHTLGDPLDLFVLFSSVSSVVGTPGQANYAAASAFLDGLAHFRQSKSLPALSINWGAWAEGGLGASRVMAEGRRGIGLREGGEIFKALLGAGSAQPEVIVSTDWSAYFRAGGHAPAAFSHVLSRATATGVEGSSFDAKGVSLGSLEEVEAKLLEIWRRVLGQPDIDIDADFHRLGGDSLTAIEVASAAIRSGVPITAGMIADQPTIRALSRYVVAEKTSAPVSAPGRSVSGYAPLLPLQHAALGFAYDVVLPPRVYEVPHSVEAESVEEVAQELWRHHDALRSRFIRTAWGGWRLFIEPVNDAEQILHVMDISQLPAEQHELAAMEQMGRLIQAMRPDEGTVARIAYFDRGPERSRWIILAVHRLVSDQMSQVILSQDLVMALDQVIRDRPIALPHKTTDIQTWGETLQKLAEGAFDDEVTFLHETEVPIAPLLTTLGVGQRTQVGDCALNESETHSLRARAGEKWGSQLGEVLAAAVGLALSRWVGLGRVGFLWTSRGRDHAPSGIDLSRTVGGLWCMCPHVLDLDLDAGPADALRAVQDSHQRTPHGGLGFSTHYYAGRTPGLSTKLREHGVTKVIVNFLGDLDRLEEVVQSDAARRITFGAASSELSPGNEPDRPLGFPVQLTLSIAGGCLRGKVRHFGRDPRAVEQLSTLLLSAAREFIRPAK
ncbi:MAG: SDR family NAD(P)-dependent oxidoreductase [Myxococcaceae bacterium]